MRHPHPDHQPRHHQPNPEIGTFTEVEQFEDYGPVPPLDVCVVAPVNIHQLPTRMAVLRTIGILAPERILAADLRRKTCRLIVSNQGLRLGRSISELSVGGSGQVGVASGGTGPQFSTSGGGTGGFLLPIGIPIEITTADAVYAASDNYGTGNAASMVSIMIEQWAD